MKLPKKCFFTLIVIGMLFLSACGGESSRNGSDNAAVERGQTVFQANCSACHSTNSDATLVGPSLVGLASRAGEMVDGLDTKDYIEQSILEPGAYVNEGFEDLMPKTYQNALSSQDLDALIAYLLTLD